MPRDDTSTVEIDDRDRLKATCVRSAVLLDRAEPLAAMSVSIQPGMTSIAFRTLPWPDRKASLDQLAAAAGGIPRWEPETDGAVPVVPVGWSNPEPGTCYYLDAELPDGEALLAIAYRQEETDPGLPGDRRTSTAGVVTALLDIGAWAHRLDPRVAIDSIDLADTGERLDAFVALAADGDGRAALRLAGATHITQDIPCDPASLVGHIRLTAGTIIQVTTY